MINNLLCYFSGEGPFTGLGLPNLSRNYVWPKKGEFPSYSHLGGFTNEGGTNYEKNIALKTHSPKIWADGDKQEIANWVVSTWGGIHTNKASTLAKYVDDIVSGDIPSDLKGVASYSKILSFMNPHTFAIYDARVAISLNAIQLILGNQTGTAFNYLSGRNTALEKFRKHPSTPIRELSSRGWQRIHPNECYTLYLCKLNEAKAALQSHALYELEMALFADAEVLSEMYLNMTNRR
jgi:hypothetical protein